MPTDRDGQRPPDAVGDGLQPAGQLRAALHHDDLGLAGLQHLRGRGEMLRPAHDQVAADVVLDDASQPCLVVDDLRGHEQHRAGKDRTDADEQRNHHPRMIALDPVRRK